VIGCVPSAPGGCAETMVAPAAQVVPLVVLEPLAERRELCHRLRLSAAAPDAAAARQFDLSLDCVARPETLEAAIEAVPPQGSVILVGIWSDYVPLPVGTVVSRETRIAGSYGYSHQDFGDVARWLGDCGIDRSSLIQCRVGFDGVVAASEDYAAGSLTAVRTLFKPGPPQGGKRA
jgi:threonine dehydrogenase-like Zn-dependent dehydrogenase